MEERPKNADFGKLSQLLSLKRHEAPTPRFFDELPGRIMRGIEQDRPAGWESALDRLLSVSWFQPVAACAMAVLVGGLIIVAVTQPAGSDPSGQAMFPNPDGGMASTNLPTSNSLTPWVPR